MQNRLRIACARFWHWNCVEHRSHVFHNGYRLFALKCIGALEDEATIAFNEAAVLAGDELVGAFGVEVERGIVVVVDVEVLDGEPRECVAIYVIAECATTCNGVTVRFPLAIDEQLGVLREAPVEPLHLVTNLKARVFDSARHAVIRPCASEREEVAAGFQHAQNCAPHVHVVSDPSVVPRLAHEPQLVGRVGDD